MSERIWPRTDTREDAIYDLVVLPTLALGSLFLVVLAATYLAGTYWGTAIGVVGWLFTAGQIIYREWQQRKEYG